MIFFGKNRRPKDEVRLLPLFLTIAMVIFVMVGFAYSVQYKKNSDTSYLYEIVGDMGPDGEENRNVPEDIPFQHDTPEAEFLLGLQAFWQEDYALARTHMENARDNLQIAYDRGLPGYTYYFLSRIAYIENGEADFGLIENTIGEAMSFAPLANSHQRIWQLLLPAVNDADSSERVKYLLKELLGSEVRLELEAQVRYNNLIAMLDYEDGNRAMSLTRFYDVRKLLDGKELSGELLKQSMFCVSYIAGFYYEFNDLDQALELYLNNVGVVEDDPVLDARQKYSDYLNIVGIYLDRQDCENARHYAGEALKLLKYLPDELALELEIALYENYARSYIYENELEDAEKYFSKADELMSRIDHDSPGYLENRVYLSIARALYFRAKGDDAAAGEVLLPIVDDGSAMEMGKDMEVYELLVDIYRNSEDIRKYYPEYAALMKSQEEHYNVIKREYLDLSRYYATVGILMDDNDVLKNLNRTSYVVIGLVLAALVVSLAVLKTVLKANLTDQLTSVYNRKKLNRLVEKYKVSMTPGRIGVVMIDIDYFKRYNDTYGHVKGDEVLKQVAKAIKSSVRKKDVLIRYGGEEFMIIIDNVDEITARTVCDRVLQRVRDQRIPHKASDASDRVTVSMGLCYSFDKADLEAMIAQADKALYTTKTRGRNHKTVVQYQRPIE